MKTLVVLFSMYSGITKADDLIELRVTSQGEYRYADWSHSFKNKLATDVYYIGVPGNNEFSACLGYSLPIFHGISATPFFCVVVAKEDKEAGVKTAAVVAWQKGKWQADAYVAHFTPLRGQVSPYDLLDDGNLTRNLGKGFELGVSTGYFRQDGKWNPLAGPMVRRNDKLGAFGVSCRLGPNNEIRFIRTFTLKR